MRLIAWTAVGTSLGALLAGLTLRRSTIYLERPLLTLAPEPAPLDEPVAPVVIRRPTSNVLPPPIVRRQRSRPSVAAVVALLASVFVLATVVALLYLDSTA